MDIVIDFDGTCVGHSYPAVGREIGATPVLRELVDAGHHLILYTMRADDPRRREFTLRDALEWFVQRYIPLYGVQSHPEQHKWTSSPKAYGDIYIDDRALGCPLIFPDDQKTPCVDWTRVREMLCAMGAL